MRDVLCFPIYDTGNMGMQRRKIWGVLAHHDFNPLMFLESKEFKFTKEMEGIGTGDCPRTRSGDRLSLVLVDAARGSVHLGNERDAAFGSW